MLFKATLKRGFLISAYLLLVLYFVLFVLRDNGTWGILAAEDNILSPSETIAVSYQRLLDVYNNRSDADDVELENQLYDIAADLFDAARIAPMTISNRWKELDTYEQNRFVGAFMASLQRKMLEQIKRFDDEGLPTLRVVNEKSGDRIAAIEYLVSGNREEKRVTVHMLRFADGNWRISNITFDNTSLVRHYFSLCSKTLERYSLAFLEAELSNSDYVVLEDFERYKVGKFPKGWHWRKKDRKKHKPYVIREENGNKYLAAEDNGESVILGKDIKWNLKKYPYVSFRWRAHILPKGGDERYGETVDSAAGIYFVFRKKFGLIPESIKYVWSTTLPVGSAMRRSGTGKPWMVVAESGDEHLGEWRTYVFNAYEAYKKTFGGRPPSRPIGLGILTDANSTHSKAYADYDDIRALKHADADSGIKKILKAE
ncbi:MAG: DUF3047 domain-containing protein [bacterium]